MPYHIALSKLSNVLILVQHWYRTGLKGKMNFIWYHWRGYLTLWRSIRAPHDLYNRLYQNRTALCKMKLSLQEKLVSFQLPCISSCYCFSIHPGMQTHPYFVFRLLFNRYKHFANQPDKDPFITFQNAIKTINTTQHIMTLAK